MWSLEQRLKIDLGILESSSGARDWRCLDSVGKKKTWKIIGEESEVDIIRGGFINYANN